MTAPGRGGSTVHLRLGVCLPVEAAYEVCLRDHAGEFLLRIEHRNMAMAIRGKQRNEFGDRSGDAGRGHVGRHDGRDRQRGTSGAGKPSIDEYRQHPNLSSRHVSRDVGSGDDTDYERAFVDDRKRLDAMTLKYGGRNCNRRAGCD